MRPISRRIALAGSLLLFLALPATVAAHSEFVSGIPKSGATVPVGPIDVVGTFSETLDRKSHMELLDASDEVVARAEVDGKTMRIGLESIEPGVYEVQWTSVAEDGDILRSSDQPEKWTFTVIAPSPSPTVAPSVPPSASVPARPSVAASAAPSASPSPGSPAGTSTGDAILPIVAALIVVALIGLILFRRRMPTGR